ncbi:hypothetical protein [Arthrobacter caoxuetaonis]|uniref:Uncharacterized protein n=1 Tax=Arthrobacter caoxuetaonis TaxID=2886935 RepID=A0A9X1MGR2_9MICC|nr:hypothetical protein [Arthrobacter caoxuetaonis]MCC3299784.1 hypothetical protein [Arthrobacter caoxuetaonis]USQ59315.1 hypothetical protein NF551_17175 [Arthrobacter caoxuetaonis]
MSIHAVSRVPAGTSAGGRFAETSHTEPDIGLGYKSAHTAPVNDGCSAPIAELARVFSEEVYEHPEWYGSGETDEEAMAQLAAARSNPEALVRVYRALPPGLDRINRTDWVTLSARYARQHAVQDDDEGNDWPVISAQVPASSVFSDGNDLMEYGYDGPDLNCA